MRKVDVRVALLTNFLPFYRIPLLEQFRDQVEDLQVFLSVRTEANRPWEVNWGSLQVQVNRSISWTKKFVNPNGYRDSSEIHVPYDTLWALWRYRPDVIITGEFGMRTCFAAIYKVLRPKTKLIIWATLSEWTERARGRGRRFFRRLLIRMANSVLVNGNSGQRYIESLGFSGPIFTVPCVTDGRSYGGSEKSVVKERAFTLLFTGQLIQRKGLIPFLEVLSAWCADHPERPVAVTVVGSGPEKAALQSLSVGGDLTITFVDAVPAVKLPGYYAAADMYIFPTLGDEWGVVVNEALSAGLPVIGSLYSQAAEELLTDGSNGWLFDPGSRKSTYETIQRALTSPPEHLEAMRRNAVASVAHLTPAYAASIIAQSVSTVSGRSSASGSGE